MVSTNYTTQPIYIKVSINLILISLMGFLVFLGQSIIVPFAFALLIAVLLLPLNNFLEKKIGNRVFAILICILVSTLFLLGVFYFLANQIIGFSKDIPAIKQQLIHHANIIQNWLSAHFNINKKDQNILFNNATAGIQNTGFITDTVLSITQLLSVVLLIPVYVFLLLYYRDMIYNFIVAVFGTPHSTKVKDVLKESRYIVQGYMIGLIIEMCIVAAINAFGFILLGIDYAIFLAVLSAILNLIPYIGMLVAAAFCAIITLSTSNQMTDVLGVIAILVVVQFIDNNIIMPKVVSSKVKINALITILGVLVCGALAGVSGMFLSIPTIAILKVIFDRVDGLKPWGMLLGDEITGKKPLINFTTIKTKPKLSKAKS